MPSPSLTGREVATTLCRASGALHLEEGETGKPVRLPDQTIPALPPQR